MSAADFLEWELRQTLKHEFLRGQVFALTEASPARDRLALNLALALRAHLRATPCRTLISDKMLRVDAADACLYPDVMVTCSAADAAQALLTREPVLVVEIVSPAGAACDALDRFAACRELPTLREYLRIDIASRRCHLQRKGEGGAWAAHAFEPGQALALASVGLTLGAAALWSKVAG